MVVEHKQQKNNCLEDCPPPPHSAHVQRGPCARCAGGDGEGEAAEGGGGEKAQRGGGAAEDVSTLCVMDCEYTLCHGL